jgi:parallel beta-helix repeat protein
MTKLIPIFFLLIVVAGARADSPVVCLWGRVTVATNSVLPAAPVSEDWLVATNGTGTGAGTNWANATNNLQGAITACQSNYTVWVSNGTYVGNFINFPGVTVRSKNGLPASVVLNGNAAARVMYMAAGGQLIGVTVTNGTEPSFEGVGSGGGVYGGIVSNCIISGNSAYYAGGGAWYSTLYNCTISGNSATNGGGGVELCTLYNCLLKNNSVIGIGDGGAAWGCTLYNCTIVSNTGINGTGGNAGSSLYNCISWGNFNPANGYQQSDTFDSNPFVPNPVNVFSCGLDYTGTGSITNNPLFVSATDFSLQAGSPCRDTGTNGTWTINTMDKNGNWRIWPVGGTADMGAYEYGSEPCVITNFTVTTNISINGAGIGRIMGVVQ